MVEFGEEEGVLARGCGQGGQQTVAIGQVRRLAVDGVVEKVEEGLGRGGGNRRAKAVETALGGGEGGAVAQQVGAHAQQGLQLGVELGRGDARLAQSAHEQRQVADVGLTQALT